MSTQLLLIILNTTCLLENIEFQLGGHTHVFEFLQSMQNKNYICSTNKTYYSKCWRLCSHAHCHVCINLLQPQDAKKSTTQAFRNKYCSATVICNQLASFSCLHFYLNHLCQLLFYHLIKHVDTLTTEDICVNAKTRLI